MYLITSASYVESELATEYGKIPPVFLPIQNKKLFQHQLELFNKEELIVLSLPMGFEISKYDEYLFKSYNVKIVYTPIGLSLANSILFVVNIVARFNEPLKVLFGDTLYKKIDNRLDLYFISQPFDNYSWSISTESKNRELVYSGYFTFSSQSFLIQSILESDFNFIEAIQLYKLKQDIIEVKTNDWFDFGHSNTYYRSKMSFTTERHFNDLKIDRFSVLKTSLNNKKINAEANWFINIPSSVRKYTPALWNVNNSSNNSSYEIEYLYLSNLSELFVYGKNQLFIWKNILNACNDFLIECKNNKPPKIFRQNGNSMDLYAFKTKSRLLEYSNQANIDLDETWILNGISTPSLNQILEETSCLISEPADYHFSIIHGDFCFSNILYNFRTNSIKVIDPRGIDSVGNMTIFGDIRYDIAKLSHSVIGMYDLIIAGNFYLQNEKKYVIDFEIYSNLIIEEIQNYFLKCKFADFTLKEASTYPILIHLFLSMLPLHSDNPLRQKALMSNALRLYIDFKNDNLI